MDQELKTRHRLIANG